MTPRLVLVHGFTQTPTSWDQVADALGRRFEVLRVELAGHGTACTAPDRRPGSFAAAAAAIGDEGGRAAAYVGYSLGGRLCLRLALDRPDLMGSLVLVGASPGIADADERAARRDADERLAVELEQDGTERFLDGWLAQPLFHGTTPPPAELAARRANRADGLAWALRTLGTGAQEPLWDRLPAVEVPVLLVAGERDAKFRDVADRMRASIGPRARTAVVPDAGHAVLLDQPAALADLIARFVTAHAATR
jgi:2-succinyl-6-hydroxy-2,4-cyclohexadiene-1-carboxylate synthase